MINRFVSCLALLLSSLLVGAVAATPPWDLVIQGGRVVDGTGAPWYRADVAIDDGKIVAIGRLSAANAERTIDATGLIVAPGFVDMMGQSASSLLDDPGTARNLLTQGITTINCGEGSSAAPLSEEDGARSGWTTMREYLALLDMKGLPVNVVQSVGHTQVRRLVLGEVDRRPSDEELERMRGLVREAMEAGAIGVSTALIYPPAVFAPIEEIASLAEVAGEYGGGYYTHLRNEGDRLIEAIDEALEIGRRANTPVHLFHLKTAGRQNWGKMPLAIATIQAARASGQQVTADVYPYINNGLGITALIHPRHFAEGFTALRKRLDDAEARAEIRQEIEQTDGWENWYRHVGQDWNKIILGRAENHRYQTHAGKSLAEVARSLEEDPWETFFELVKSGAFVLPESMSEANKILAMQQDFISFCTDVGPAGGDGLASHPRAFGSFPRLLSRYVRELGALSLERAVAQASAVAANDIFTFDRGRVSVGLAADLIVFDESQVTDRADFSSPAETSQGMKWVIVNGVIVLNDGQPTKARPGKVLRGPGYDESTAPAQQRDHGDQPTLAAFDRMAKDFIEKHHVPGMAVAVTDRGRLVHASGYGYADLARQTAVIPETLFRIASLSKPITAVAVLQLAERGKLQLDDPVTKYIDCEAEFAAAGEECDQRWKQITIEHLLQHRGGWDRDVSMDPMFQSVRFARQLGIAPPAGARDVLRAMISRPLDFDPGARSAYSNFGYSLLGRVIENVSGDTYESYVQSQVLAPLGIDRMRIGRTRWDERLMDETRYYHPGSSQSVFAEDLDEEVPSPYGGWYLEAMDSHGGWLASAVDLARFAAAFDDPDHCPILSRESIDAMHRRPEGAAGHDEEGQPRDVYYSLGWQNRDLGDGKFNHWHNGSLPGTATVLIRRHDGKNFVALLNTRVSPTSSSLTSEIDRALHQAASRVDRWPDVEENGVEPLPQAHAHNDYLHTRPLLDALDLGFTSVEADVFLVEGELLVAHTAAELNSDRTLRRLYLDPLRDRIRSSGGSLYPEGVKFQLLIDFKSEAEPTYAALKRLLAEYPEMITVVREGRVEQKPVDVVISGNRPFDAMAAETVRWAGLDGRLSDLDSVTPVHEMPLISDRWGASFEWSGRGAIDDAERRRLEDYVDRAHAAGRRLRFWGTPDTREAWSVLRAAGVDHINTDDLPGLAEFLRQADE